MGFERQKFEYGDGGEEDREEIRLSRQWEWLDQRRGCVQGLWGFSVAGDMVCIWVRQSPRGGLRTIW